MLTTWRDVFTWKGTSERCVIQILAFKEADQLKINQKLCDSQGSAATSNPSHYWQSADHLVNCLVRKMSSLWEKCLSQFPRQQSDVVTFLLLYKNTKTLHLLFMNEKEKQQMFSTFCLKNDWSKVTASGLRSFASFLCLKLTIHVYELFIYICNLSVRQNKQLWADIFLLQMNRLERITGSNERN